MSESKMMSIKYDPSMSIGPANPWPTYLQFGEIRIHFETGEVTGLSENISEDARLFWECIKKEIL
jgi:hypothetical protein